MPELRIRESYVEVEDGFQVWTQILGGGGKNEDPALLILHEGPGAAHDYLDNLAALAADSQPVVFYDQLGCGKSDQPNDPARWALSRFNGPWCVTFEWHGENAFKLDLENYH